MSKLLGQSDQKGVKEFFFPSRHSLEASLAFLLPPASRNTFLAIVGKFSTTTKSARTTSTNSVEKAKEENH
jgi:hypothetical protein